MKDSVREALKQPRLKDLAILTDWSIFTIFDAVVVRGWIEGYRFTGEIRCFDGYEDKQKESIIFTNDGPVRINNKIRVKTLVGVFIDGL